MSIRGLALIAALLIAAVLPAEAAKSGPKRKVPVDMFVIHSTGGPTCDEHGKAIWVGAGERRENLRAIEAHPRLGIHFMVDRDGTVVSSVPEDRVAHHVFHYSERSIGIELVNDGDGVDPFPPGQLAALTDLLRRLTRKYDIAESGVKRHSDVDRGYMECAPTRRRKVDPGAAFPFGEVLRRVYKIQ